MIENFPVNVLATMRYGREIFASVGNFAASLKKTADFPCAIFSLHHFARFSFVLRHSEYCMQYFFRARSVSKRHTKFLIIARMKRPRDGKINEELKFLIFFSSCRIFASYFPIYQRRNENEKKGKKSTDCGNQNFSTSNFHRCRVADDAKAMANREKKIKRVVIFFSAAHAGDWERKNKNKEWIV